MGKLSFTALLVGCTGTPDLRDHISVYRGSAGEDKPISKGDTMDIDRTKKFVCQVTDKIVNYDGCRQVRPPLCQHYETCGIKSIREAIKESKKIPEITLTEAFDPKGGW